MGFSKMLELLQEKNKGYIILANAGAFYLARGKDAVKLNEILGLKLLCMEPEVCKIGIPVNSIETYMKKIEEKEYSYIVYYFNQQTNRLEVIKKYTGKNKNTGNGNFWRNFRSTLRSFRKECARIRDPHGQYRIRWKYRRQ